MSKARNFITYADSSQGDRKMVVIDGQPYYQSTGKNSGVRGRWFPFVCIRGKKPIAADNLPHFYSIEGLKSFLNIPSEDLGQGCGHILKLTNEFLNDSKGEDSVSNIDRIPTKTTLIVSSRLGRDYGGPLLRKAGLSKEEIALAKDWINLEHKTEVTTDDPEKINEWLIAQGATLAKCLLVSESKQERDDTSYTFYSVHEQGSFSLSIVEAASIDNSSIICKLPNAHPMADPARYQPLLQNFNYQWEGSLSCGINATHTTIKIFGQHAIKKFIQDYLCNDKSYIQFPGNKQSFEAIFVFLRKIYENDYQKAVKRVQRLKIEAFKSLANYLNNLLETVAKIKNESTDLHELNVLIDVLEKTDKLLCSTKTKEQARLKIEYLTLADQMQGHPQKSYKILGGIMMAIGALVCGLGTVLAIGLAIPSLGSSIIAGKILIGVGTSLCASGLGFFAYGRRKGLSKIMYDIPEAPESEKKPDLR